MKVKNVYRIANSQKNVFLVANHAPVAGRVSMDPLSSSFRLRSIIQYACGSDRVAAYAVDSDMRNSSRC